jgi:hypothetical protein
MFASSRTDKLFAGSQSKYNKHPEYVTAVRHPLYETACQGFRLCEPLTQRVLCHTTGHFRETRPIRFLKPYRSGHQTKNVQYCGFMPMLAPALYITEPPPAAAARPRQQQLTPFDRSPPEFLINNPAIYRRDTETHYIWGFNPVHCAISELGLKPRWRSVPGPAINRRVIDGYNVSSLLASTSCFTEPLPAAVARPRQQQLPADSRVKKEVKGFVVSDYTFINGSLSDICSHLLLAVLCYTRGANENQTLSCGSRRLRLLNLEGLVIVASNQTTAASGCSVLAPSKDI